ncbi:MAG: T9SS type A sorting domain-containing protein [Flavobacteriales bacterium]|jgi:hypothetical protein|nr:T9SS type A sorting domain-containing protein [Flavobacteriales bacterium]MCB0758685.1 T9SS type A sorting domain-containing protein [Flavobacteriales bacterium]
MKHTYTVALFLLSLATMGVAQAQIVSITDGDGQPVNGTTVIISEPLMADTTQVLGIGFNAENVSGSGRTINVKRYELSVPTGTKNYFCWDLCYDAIYAGARPAWTSLDPIYVDNGQTVNGFHGYYMPMAISGEASFRYVWYDVDSPNDSTWVDLHFSALSVGIQEVTSPVLDFEAFPNPSIGGNITFNYELANASTGTRLAIYNMLGERKLVRAIGAAQGKVVIRDGDLTSGVWFAVLERNGKPLATKRLVVVR